MIELLAFGPLPENMNVFQLILFIVLLMFMFGWPVLIPIALTAVVYIATSIIKRQSATPSSKVLLVNKISRTILIVGLVLIVGYLLLGIVGVLLPILVLAPR